MPGTCRRTAGPWRCRRAVRRALVEVASGRGRGGLENDVGKTANQRFSPDGRLLAAVGENEVRLWCVATGDLVGRLGGCGGQADCLAFSPDSKRLAVSEGRNTVLIFDVDALAFTVPSAGRPLGKGVGRVLERPVRRRRGAGLPVLGRLSADPRARRRLREGTKEAGAGTGRASHRPLAGRPGRRRVRGAREGDRRVGTPHSQDGRGHATRCYWRGRPRRPRTASIRL